MDNKKDDKITTLASFFDRIPARLSIPANQTADRLFRRAERIAAGIFLATNHLDQEDRLRISVRDAALELLHETAELRDEIRNQQSARVVDFKATARYIVSLLRLLAVSGSLSMQNASVLVEALDELGVFLSSAQVSPLADTVSLRREDLLDASTKAPFVKDMKKDTPIVKDRPNMSDNRNSKGSDVRKQNVLDVLRSGGAMGIADISAHLPEYSTKMIQRDLAELIAAGMVSRVGDKRWSRYSIAGGA